MKFYHPLLNVPLPSVDDLIKRCVDAEAVKLLELACRLASYRTQRSDSVNSNNKEYISEFCLKTNFTSRFYEHTVLTEQDLLRAFLGSCASFLEEKLIYGRSSKVYSTSLLFREASSHWSDILNTYNCDPQPLLLNSMWGRRWALKILEQPNLEIDKKLLLGSVFYRIPPDWLQGYCDGLITKEEAKNSMMDILHHSSSRCFFFPVPQGLYDRHGLMDKANDQLRYNAGIFIVGDQKSRANLYRALTSIINYDSKLTELENIKDSGANFYFTSNIVNELASDEPYQGYTTYAFQGNITLPSGDPAWCFDQSDKQVSGTTTIAINFFEHLAKLKLHDKKRFVIAMSYAEFDKLSKITPTVLTIPIINIPPVTDKHIVPCLLSLLPEILDRSSCHIGFELMMEFLFQSFELRPEIIPTITAERFASYISPDKENYGLMVTSPYEARNTRSFSILSNSHKYRKTTLQKTIEDLQPNFEKYIGDIEDFYNLGHIYEIFSRLNDST
jgi:hypothetical protein